MNEHNQHNNHSYPADISEKVNKINEFFFNKKSKNEQAVDINL